MSSKKNLPITSLKKNKLNKGQSFIEFIFLLFTIIACGYTLLSGLNHGIGGKWVQMIAIITSPDPNNLQTPTLR